MTKKVLLAISTLENTELHYWASTVECCMIDDRWISVEEVAAYLGVKRDTIYKWINRRNMPAHKVGRLWKFRKEEVDDWVRQDKAGDRQRESTEE